MMVRRRLWVLGGLLALASRGVAEEVQWRPVGAAKPAAIIPVTANVPAVVAAPADAIQTPPPVPSPVPVAPPATPSEPVAAPQSSIVVPPNDSSNPLPQVLGGEVSADPCACSSEAATCWSPRFWFGNAGPADHQGWVRGEFLAWWTKGTATPTLLTTSTRAFPFTTNAAGNPVVNPANVGTIGVALGDPNTVVVLDGKDLDNQFRAGGRFAAGWWFDPCSVHGVDGSVFFTGQRTSTFAVNTGAIADLYRPFVAINPNINGVAGTPFETNEIVGIRSIGLTGNFEAKSSSFFWGADLNYRRNLWQGCTARADLFAGFRYLHLDERLQITELNVFTRDTTFVDNTGAPIRVVPAGLRIDNLDRFTTHNDFYGGQIGADLEYRRDRWTVGLRPSVALGTTYQRLSVVGAYRESINGVTTAGAPGGLYALSSNIGKRSDSAFACVPELTLRFGYDVTPNLRVTAGYDFLYWSSVVRPGDQIDRTLDLARVPYPAGTTVSPARPAALFETTDFWAQGLNAGVEYRW